MLIKRNVLKDESDLRKDALQEWNHLGHILYPQGDSHLFLFFKKLNLTKQGLGLDNTFSPNFWLCMMFIHSHSAHWTRRFHQTSTYGCSLILLMVDFVCTHLLSVHILQPFAHIRFGKIHTLAFLNYTGRNLFFSGLQTIDFMNLWVPF